MCTLPTLQPVPVSPEDFSIEVFRHPLLITAQIPQGLVHSVNLCTRNK